MEASLKIRFADMVKAVQFQTECLGLPLSPDSEFVKFASVLGVENPPATAGYSTITIKVDQEYDEGIPGKGTRRTNREDFDKVLDHFGLFPRATLAITDEKLEEIQKELRKAKSLAQEIISDTPGDNLAGPALRAGAEEIMLSLMGIQAILGLPTVEE